MSLLIKSNTRPIVYFLILLHLVDIVLDKGRFEIHHDANTQLIGLRALLPDLSFDGKIYLFILIQVFPSTSTLSIQHFTKKVIIVVYAEFDLFLHLLIAKNNLTLHCNIRIGPLRIGRKYSGQIKPIFIVVLTLVFRQLRKTMKNWQNGILSSMSEDLQA